MQYTLRYCMDWANRASKRVRYRGYNMVAYKGWSVSRVVENHIFSRALASENWDFLQRVTLIYLFRHTMLYPISDTRHKKGKCSDFCSISRNWNTACISAVPHNVRINFTYHVYVPYKKRSHNVGTLHCHGALCKLRLGRVAYGVFPRTATVATYECVGYFLSTSIQFRNVKNKLEYSAILRWFTAFSSPYGRKLLSLWKYNCALQMIKSL